MLDNFLSKFNVIQFIIFRDRNMLLTHNNNWQGLERYRRDSIKFFKDLNYPEH